MTFEPVVRGTHRARSRSPVPSTSWDHRRERSRSPRPSTSREYRSATPKQLSTDMAEWGSYRRLRRPITLADYAKGEDDYFRYPSAARDDYHRYPPAPRESDDFRYQSEPTRSVLKVKFDTRTLDHEAAYERARETGTPIPEQWIDPVPEPRSPTGYSDFSSDDYDFRQLGGYGKKSKSKRKNKKY